MRFCRTSDGADVAHATSGTGRPLVQADEPAWSVFLTEVEGFLDG